MNTQVLLGVMTLLACSAASADELGARLAAGANHAPAAMLYLEFPIAARHHEGPVFGLRMERLPGTDLAGLRTDTHARSATVIDVPFNKKRGDTQTQALNLIGPGMIVGIVVGALVVLSAANDDSDGGGGGY